MEWFLKCWRQYADFSGRARRQEYWTFTLFNCICMLVLTFIDTLIEVPVFSTLYSLAVLVPSLAVCVRRLHDVGKSGWMYFICLIPLVGAIWLLVLFCTEGERAANNWGPDPKVVE